MNAKRDCWLLVTVLSCLVAMLALPVCVLSFAAAARWEREAAEPHRPQRIRIDLRVPSALAGLGFAALAVCAYRLYARHLRKPE